MILKLLGLDTIPIFSKQAAIGVDTLTKSIKGLTIEEAVEKMAADGAAEAEMRAALSRQNYTKESIDSAMAAHANAMAKQTEAVATNELTAAEATEALMQQNLLAQDAKELLISSGIVTAKEFEENATIKVTAAKLQEAVANGTLSVTDAEVIAGAFGITLANGVEATSFNILTASIWANIKAFAGWLLTNPIGQALLLTGAVVGLAHAFDLIPKSVEDAESELSDVQSKLSDVNSEIEERENRIKELEELEAPSLVDEEELKRLKEENEELKIRQKYLQEQERYANQELVDATKRKYSQEFGDGSNLSEAKQYQKTWGSGHKGVQLYNTIEDIEKYKDKKSQAKNGKEAEKWSEKIQEAEGDLINLRLELQEFYDDLYASGASSQELDDVKNKLKQIDDILMSPREQLFNFINGEEVSKNKEELISLAVSGELTSEKLEKNFSNVSSYLEENELTIEDLISALKTLQEEIEETGKKADKNLSFTDRMSKVENLSTGFDQLDKIYADVKDGKEFDYSSILNNEDFKNTFGSYTEEYDNFIKTITNSPKDIKACQQAFNDLSTAYIYNQDALKNVTEETKESTILMLKQMGVTNAEEVVTAALTKAKSDLASKEESLSVAKKLGIKVSENLEDATYDEIATLYNNVSALNAEGQASDTTRQYLANLALSKVNLQNIRLDTKSDINQIVALANAAGTSAEYVNALKRALNNLQNKSNAVGDYVKNQAKTVGKGSYLTTGFKVGMIVKTEEVKSAQTEFEESFAEIQKASLKASDFYVPVEYGGGTNSNKDSGGSSSESEETFDWIETKISRIEREIENLGQTADASYKLWADRNSALADEMSKVTDEIKVQQQAYDYYMNKANSVGLSSIYQNLVKNGAIKIETLKDEKLIEKINSYTEWYEKALDCKDAIQDLNDELANLARQKFDNISSEFENLMSVVEHELNMLDAYVSQTEERGRFVSTKYYSSMIALEKQNIALLESEYAKLNASLNEAVNSGQIQKYSEEWYNMAGEINSVSEELVEANTSIIEFQNSIRDLEWEVFDKLQEFISQIQGESEFLQELMSDEKMFSDEGSITEYGRATLGLHAVNYETYMRQANDYAEELKKINKEIAEDPNNLTLLERRQELLEAQKDMIKSAKDEKQAMKDLIEEGYNTFLDYMQELIDKRKEAMQSIKDLYDYEKNVSEQTDEIARLQKIIDSYGGDNSEETKAKLQEYTVQLQDAKEALEETEYERYLSDQEKMLDNIYD